MHFFSGLQCIRVTGPGSACSALCGETAVDAGESVHTVVQLDGVSPRLLRRLSS